MQNQVVDFSQPYHSAGLKFFMKPSLCPSGVPTVQLHTFNAKCLNLKQFQLEAAEKKSQNNMTYEISAFTTLEQERSTQDKSTMLYFKTQIHK